MNRLETFVRAWMAGRLMALVIAVPILLGSGLGPAHLVELDKSETSLIYHQIQQPPRTEMYLWLNPEKYGKTQAGKDNRFFLEVRNTGNTAINNIRLSSEPPEGWIVEFKQTEIDKLAPGQSKTIDVNIRPRRDFSNQGSRSFSIIAEADEIRRAQIVSVQAPRGAWIWVGIAVATVVVAAAVVVFVRLNRA